MKKKNELMVIEGQSITEDGFFNGIDEVVQELYQTGNIDKAMLILARLKKLEDVTGHGKAMLLYGIKMWWDETGQTEKHNMEFVDYVEGEGILKKTSIDRYLKIQGYIEDLSIPKEFHSRPMRDLTPIANALGQGVEISKEQWGELRLTKDEAEVNNFIQEKVKKKQPRKNKKQIVWERDGTLTGWMNNQSYYLGYLDKKQYENDPIAHQFIEMILDKFKVKVK